MRYRGLTYSLSLILITMISLPGYSQSVLDLPKVPKNLSELKSSTRIEGTINANMSVYAISQFNNRRPPFVFNIYGTPTLYVNDIVIPMRLTLGTYQNKYRQEFNKLGISPRYKSFTLHLGHSTVNFSPLALSGHSFLGAGFEWNPNKLRMGAIVGRFMRKIQPDQVALTTQQNLIPSFRRSGAGFKAGFGEENNFIDIIVFKAKDRVESLSDLSSSIRPLPQENAVLAISARKSFLKNFDFNLDIAFSAYTKNLNDPLAKVDRFVMAKIPAILLQDHSSTQYLKAIQGGLKYKLKETSFDLAGKEFALKDVAVGLKYDRIEPGYASMGTYFFRNDIQRFQVQSSFKALENKLRVSLPIGYEHDDLLNTKKTQTRKTIYGLTANYRHSQDLFFTLVSSNFRTKLYQDAIPVTDTLIINHVNKNYSLSGVYLMKKDGSTNQLSSRIGYMTGKNISETNPVRDIAKLYATSSYKFKYKPLDLSLTPSFGIYFYKYPNFSTFRIIPSVTAQKMFFGSKMNASFNTGTIIAKGIFSIRNHLQISYKLDKKNTLSCKLYSLINIIPMATFAEMQIDIRYAVTL